MTMTMTMTMTMMRGRGGVEYVEELLGGVSFVGVADEAHGDEVAEEG